MSTVMMTLAAVAAMQTVCVHICSGHDCGYCSGDYMCILW